MIDLSRSRWSPFAHQIIGVQAIVNNTFFLLADEMGAGKTKQAIDAAQVLFLQGKINKVLTIAPAAVRGVWFHPERGELHKHLWTDLPVTVTEFHRQMDRWVHCKAASSMPFLDWTVTNYEYVRSGDYLEEILEWVGPKTLLILDESSKIKNAQAKQTKACMKIRAKCGRVLLLNGTPIANSPGDMYSQGRIMHMGILECRNYFEFRARYAIMGGWQAKQIVGWRMLDDLQQRFSPYVLRRLKKDCLDLPEKMPPVLLETPLSPALWRTYCDMRDEMVTWLSRDEVSVASHSIVKIMRLAQITSGFIGGVEAEQQEDFGDLPNYIETVVAPAPRKKTEPMMIIGDEKLAQFLGWLEDALYEKPNLKFIVWCRFKPEAFRIMATLKEKFPQITAAGLYGSQSKAERDYVLDLLDPAKTVPGPACAIATLGTGSIGLTLTAADTNYYISLNQSLLDLDQSRDRTHRPTQVNAVSYFYALATGPKGQKTIDHILFKQLEKKEDLAKMTAGAWVKALTEE